MVSTGIRKQQTLFRGHVQRIIFSGAITDYSYGSFLDILPRLLSSGVPRDAIIHEKITEHQRASY